MNFQAKMTNVNYSQVHTCQRKTFSPRFEATFVIGDCNDHVIDLRRELRLILLLDVKQAANSRDSFPAVKPEEGPHFQPLVQMIWTY